MHRQFLLHYCPAEKHQQYSFMHLELRQLQNFYYIFYGLSIMIYFLNLNYLDQLIYQSIKHQIIFYSGQQLPIYRPLVSQIDIIPIMQGESKVWKKKVVGNRVLADVRNPLRNFVQKVLPSIDFNLYPDRPKDTVDLSIGDPTTSLDFRTNKENLQILSLNVGKVDGYTNMQGLDSARDAVANKFTVDSYNTNKEDVFLSCGGSLAIWATMNLLAGQGDNFLFPSPGFPLALTIAKSMGVQPRLYHLRADDKWNASIQQMESLIDQRTKFILVNDPSNPLGSSWSIESKLKILELSKRRNLPILADQIYEGMIYEGTSKTFSELVTAEDAEYVTIFKCSGLTKRYLGPGWRLGWIILYASEAAKTFYRPLLRGIFNVILMPNTVLQASVAQILNNPNNDNRMNQCMAMMKINQQALKDGLKNEEYCTFGHSAGALYATVIVDLAKVNFENTIDFAKQFYAEENVKAFPGEFFTSKVPFIRLVISCQNEKILAFLERFTRFCKRHLRVSQ